MTDMRYVTWLATCRRCCWPLACSGISLQRGSREWSAHSSAMGFPHRCLVGKYGPSGPLALSSAQGVRFGRPPSLTPHQRREAMERLAQGAAQAELARSYGVSQPTISRLAAPGPFEASAVGA